MAWMSSTCWLLWLLLSSTRLSAHWIGLHVWYDDSLEQESSVTLLSNESRLMQRDSSSAPDALYFHQPRPLPACHELPGLTQPQIHICRLFSDHMRSVIQGARLGVLECRWQFRHHHWNCSSPAPGETEPLPKLRSSFSANTTREPVSDKWNSVLSQGSQEVAFAHAVWSAAVTQAVARSCREGSLASCACGKTPRPADLKSEWRWGGCGDNLHYGYKFAADFVDSVEKEEKKLGVKALVNLHNNEAGRRAVLKKTKIACKCHGVSGSCALVTCWHQVPSFRDIGDELRERYAEATLVKMNRRGRLQVKRSGVKVPSVQDLVYVQNSPNYCKRNETLGVPGVSGRVCSRTSTGPDGCKQLCCNQGFRTSVVRRTSRCQCKFVWCCTVECQECSKSEKISSCK